MIKFIPILSVSILKFNASFTFRSRGKKEKKNDLKPAAKVDTNLVKLKLLEASRRARMKKPAFTQTEPIKTKMLKDEMIDTDDLIQSRNNATETEENFLTFKTKDGECKFSLFSARQQTLHVLYFLPVIITSTHGINTEKILTEAASTQTYMPRSQYGMKGFDDDDESADDENLDQPHRELRKIEKRFKSFQTSDLKARSSVTLKKETLEMISIEPMKKIEDLCDSGSDDSLHERYQPGFTKSKKKFPEQPFSTAFPLARGEDWSSCQDMVLGQRFLNARFSSNAQRKSRQFMEHVTWNPPQLQAVTGLMNEANMLLEMFDQVAMLLGPDVKLHDVSGTGDF